ncbi:MDR/zinc-dependent alcohol dehydrogenase-like family protein [Vulcaniibacterium tengchongense]|uniref:2-desacetyl-2-hydroxyethyl bacteriochlorophyllide A dehydrogenase n=1 Tax=Vulcaniibacterium tengchongense TaxID=1273429 RepID=A0A3N4VMT2_9GAMM|nr:zinc-binding dehydrogenase [Vulcaniibacterium tengchongense]RPE81129.1 2-desacetyl-2-hydroxyethyl bacteriochlorophyllide A dehydrogenase [Vulcaniibacterium tengchongense]
MSAMRAAVFCGDGRIEVQRRPRPRPAAGQVGVRLHGSGVCASNLPVWAGKPWFRYPLAPGAPGHEGWGEIAEVGDGVGQWRVGDRVALLSGHAYAEYDVADGDALVLLPPSLGERPLPGEPLACAMNIFRRSDIRAGQKVAIVGVGFIGALLIQLIRDAGAEAVALSRRPFALEVARRCGASEAIATGDMHAAVGQAREISGGTGYARVIEAAGEQATLDIASAISAEGGRLVIAGYHQDGPRQVDMQQWNWRGLDVINAHERDPQVALDGLREAIAAVAGGRLDPFPLLTHDYPLERLADAFAAMQQRPDGFLKATVRP